MKKILLAVFLVLFCPSFAYAEYSKEYMFAYNLLNSLHLCQWAMDYMPKETDDFQTMMVTVMNQNRKFDEAIIYLNEYLNSSDEQMQTIAKGVIGGISLLIDANNQLLERLRKISNEDLSAVKDFEYATAQAQVQKKEGWELLSRSATFVGYVLAESAKDRNPTGPIPFKISKDEREELLKRLNDLFKDRLNKYYEYQELRKQGKQGNPDDQTWLIFSVDHIKSMLIVETYEESKSNIRN